MYYLKLYFNLMEAGLRSQMQYKASFILQLLGNLLITTTEFMAIVFIFGKFSHIKGWSLWEVGLLYGMTSVSFATSEIVARGFHVFDRMIRLGNFDRVLLRPAGVLIQILAAELELRKLGRLTQGLVVMIIAWYMQGLGLNLAKIGLLIAALISGAIFYTAIFIAGATICFWSVQSTELPNMLTYGGVEASSYPIPVYKRWFRNTLIFVIPLAFINYFPALYLLDRPDPLGLPYLMRFLFPLASAAAMIAAVKFWDYGVRHYKSTGS
jgi:ABC-2 type transport system permease protein